MVINIIANAAQGSSLSGGDRIFIENARRWAKEGSTVNIFVWEEGYQMCQRYHLNNVNHHMIKILKYKRLGFIVCYLLRIIKGSFKALQFKFNEGEKNVIYSASDFLPDIIPGFLMKLKNKKSKWVASILLIIKSPTIFIDPLDNSKIDFKTKIKNVFYYISQKISLFLLRAKADALWVLNREDKEYFQKNGIYDKEIGVMKGGVDFRFLKSIQSLPERYNACFFGRLHLQKGITDLIKIWEIVCQQYPRASLVIIGEGTDAITKLIKRQIVDLNLGENIIIFGLVDHTRQFSIIKSSDLFLLPSYYESFGIVVAEAMACDLPVIAYDLNIFSDLFPKGMIVVPKGDIQQFAEAIVFLLKNKIIAQELATQGRDLVKQYDWDTVSKTNRAFLEKLFA